MSGRNGAAGRRGGWPRGLMGMLALVLAVEGYLGHHDRDYTTVWASAWSQSGKAARREAVGADVLCLGDSLVKHGVLPRVIEARSGLRALNLAVFNGQVPTSYFLLRRALNAGARPKAVIVDAELLEVDPRIHARLWADLLTLPECVELARNAEDASFLGQIATAHLVPSVKDRYEIRADVLLALKGETNIGRLDLPANWRNWRQNQGAHIMPSSDGPPPVLVDQLRQTNYLPGPAAPHPINAKYIKKLLALAHRHSLPVYWLLPPVHPEVADRRERGGYNAHLTKFLDSLRAIHPGLVVLDGRRSNYSPSAMHDLTHLNRRGAESLSNAIGSILAEGPGANGSGWVALPTFRDPDIGVPVEDLQESRIAISQRTTARR